MVSVPGSSSTRIVVVSSQNRRAAIAIPVDVVVVAAATAIDSVIFCLHVLSSQRFDTGPRYIIYFNLVIGGSCGCCNTEVTAIHGILYAYGRARDVVLLILI